MFDRNEAALQAATKALEHAVLPAVDPADPLAVEQLRLVMGYLKLLQSRMALIPDRARFDLAHHQALAEALAEAADAEGGEVAERFSAAMALAATARHGAEIGAATAALAGAVSGLVRAVASAEPERRRLVERTVAEHSRRWIDARRAWFAPLGFELRPTELPPLADALDIDRFSR
jgi:hypothetical protein